LPSIYFWQKQTQEENYARVIKADLNLYYVLYKQYPDDTRSLLEGLRKDTYQDKKETEKQVLITEKSIRELKDFNYVVRGDEQAYKFTYMGQFGRKEVQGEYQKDFH